MSGGRYHHRQRLDDRGSALLVSVMVLAALGIVGTALVFSSISDRRVSNYERDSADALAAAETGIAFAKRMIQDLTAPIGDFDADGRPDFTIQDSLPWGGEYRVVAEAGEIRDIDISAYRAEGYTLVAEGTANGAVRRVRVEMAHDSFLKYARFVEETGTGYGCLAVLTGELYLGGDLNVPNCASGDEVTFMEYVATSGDIPNASAGIFMRGYVTDAPPIDLQNSVDFSEVSELARGVAPENDCAGVGSVGLYQDPANGWDPIGLGGPNQLDLSLFDFYETTTVPGDTIIAYDGNPVLNTLTAQPLRSRDFNGVIYFPGDAQVEGTMNGRSGRSITVYAGDDVIATDNIITGFTGFDPITGLPNSSGDPVNLGLVGADYFYLGSVPRICRIDAALMAVGNNWRALSTSQASHPPVLVGPLDLDLDGIVGENPNHDPVFGQGWNEMTPDSDTWVLNIQGPIITRNGGSASPWSSGAVVGSASGPTRRYTYDLDITEFPPPCYPVPLNLWLDVSWTEVFDSEAALESYLP